MNPELPQIGASPEAGQNPLAGVEYGAAPFARREQLSSTPERGAPAPVEIQPQPSAALPTVPTAPTPDDMTGDVNKTTPADNSTPSVAADDDLIEKEWVDKIKKIIALTRDNPYERARVIAQLQADYLKKRHNRIIGQVDDQVL